jgi:uncharacterized protein (DUF305 family)
MRKRFFFCLISNLLLVFALVACGSGSGGANHSTMPGMQQTPPASTQDVNESDPMTESLKTLSGKAFEIKFMQYMIVHHQSAIAMANLVPTHTNRSELKALATDITTAQTKEVTDMTDWLSSWYHEKPLTDTMSVPGMMGEMNTLKKAKDTAFDRQFLTMMIHHHQQAVNMARLIPQKMQRSELVTLGQNIVSTQSAEIQKMQGWQKAWFH